jgi:PIN domain nuclease of toxin-antitoxin system
VERTVIVLDTHALLWWALDPHQLSETAMRTVAEMEREVKVQRGKLELGIGIDEFVRRVEESAAIEFVPVDTTTWLSSLRLQWDHRDPADRVIVATALLKGVPILTKDTTMHAFGGVACVW